MDKKIFFKPLPKLTYRGGPDKSGEDEEVVEVGEDVPLVGENCGQEASEDPGEAGGDDTTGHDDAARDGGSGIHARLFLEGEWKLIEEKAKKILLT